MITSGSEVSSPPSRMAPRDAILGVGGRAEIDDERERQRGYTSPMISFRTGTIVDRRNRALLGVPTGCGHASLCP